jgi:hypothetical protein
LYLKLKLTNINNCITKSCDTKFQINHRMKNILKLFNSINSEIKRFFQIISAGGDQIQINSIK